MKGLINNIESFNETIKAIKSLGENGVFTRREYEDFYNGTRYQGWGQSSYYNFASIRSILKIAKIETFKIETKGVVGYTNGVDTISESAYKILPPSIKPLFKKTNKGVIEGKRYYYIFDEVAYKNRISRHNYVCWSNIQRISDEIEELKERLCGYRESLV